MRLYRLTILFIAISLTAETYSQGCNDAGLCTFGEFGNIPSEDKKQITTEISYIFGLGEQQSLVSTIQLDQGFFVFKGRGQVFIRLPFSYVYGKLGQTAGLGDMSAGLDYRVYQKDQLAISVMAGGRIPPYDANKSDDGRGLPMVYQTSLGTYDLILGAAFDIEKWRIGLGYQKPFGSNNNTFLHEFWEDDEDALEYFESYHLDRGDDLMLRLDKYFFVRNKNILTAGLLGVYRLQKDRILKDDEKISLEKSSGITLNASLAYTISLEDKGALRFLLAAPLITREHRADGLTRTLVFSLTYSPHL